MLTDNLEALSPESYRVERYLVDDPADIDGDCIDDITELVGLGSMNPVNPAPAVSIHNGAVAIPDRGTFEALSHKFDNVSNRPLYLTGLQFVKFWIFDLNSDRPVVYFMNTMTHPHHSSFYREIPFWGGGAGRNRISGMIVYYPNVLAPDGSLGVYRYRFGKRDKHSFKGVAKANEALAASMPLLQNNLAYDPLPTFALPLYYKEKGIISNFSQRLDFRQAFG